ncbi:MAG TPA: SpoIIE family protein phosphatase [Verrucomicrobiae bacterium]|jgi:serine phosphatase RsbU (regulator of sigma subunit)/anti-sigma regulatory factor (Ser/Thr protein kinase)|nr:SpoIIE family protein phosphatase [Verrucomicrobiae bacterium]
MPDTFGAFRPATLRFALPCELSQVRQAAKTAHDFLIEQGCNDDILTACDLALVEACNNAIKYAPDNARQHPVGVEITCHDGQLELRVADHTRGFDWPERVELPPPESESGRGLFLIQSLMDSAHYLRGNGENILIMRKARPSAAAHAKPVAGARMENDRLITGLLDELSSSYESLAAIFRHSATQNKAADLIKFARGVLGDLAGLVGADWFVFRTAQNQSRLDVLAASESALDMGSIIFRGENGDAAFLEAEAAVSRQAIWFDENRVLSGADPLRQKPRSRGLVYPVFVEENFVGTLVLGKNVKRGVSSPAGERAFTSSQTNIIATFAQFLALQIVNARLQEEHVAHRIIARELEIAGSIQRSLMLKELPQLPGFEIAALCRSAHQVGGDFYDVLKLTDDTALLVIADVMGKGVLAAMFAAILRAVLRATPELNGEPAALLARVNQILFDELSGVDMFITAQLAFVDVKARRLVVGSAGHCPLLVADGSTVKSLSPEGMPLGILPDAVFVSETVDLPTNCRVLLYTDGLTEAMDGAGERFGQERLTDWFNKGGHQARPARELQEDLANQLAQFEVKTGLNDDQTFLIMTG